MKNILFHILLSETGEFSKKIHEGFIEIKLKVNFYSPEILLELANKISLSSTLHYIKEYILPILDASFIQI